MSKPVKLSHGILVYPKYKTPVVKAIPSFKKIDEKKSQRLQEVIQDPKAEWLDIKEAITEVFDNSEDTTSEVIIRANLEKAATGSLSGDLTFCSQSNNPEEKIGTGETPSLEPLSLDDQPKSRKKKKQID